MRGKVANSEDMVSGETKLRQGNVFTPVCHSVHRGGLSHPPRQTPPSPTPLGRNPPPLEQCMLGYGQQAGGTYPTGMHSCLSLLS